MVCWVLCLIGCTSGMGHSVRPESTSAPMSVAMELPACTFAAQPHAHKVWIAHALVIYTIYVLLQFGLIALLKVTKETSQQGFETTTLWVERAKAVWQPAALCKLKSSMSEDAGGHTPSCPPLRTYTNHHDLSMRASVHVHVCIPTELMLSLYAMSPCRLNV